VAAAEGEQPQPPTDAQLYAEALKLELPATPDPLSADDAALDSQLAAAVLKDYVASRPGPESFPSMALQVVTLLGRRDADVSKLAQLVALDPGLSAALLRVINSAIYRSVTPVVSVRDAIVRLGLGEAGRVAGAAAAKVLFEARGRTNTIPFNADFEMFYVHSVATAVTASWMASQRTNVRSDRCYLGGLLHDIGRSIALRSVAALFAKGTNELKPRTARTYRVVEALHVSIGADVLQAWQLPAFTIDMANKHHGAAITSAGVDVESQIVAFVSALQLLRSAPLLHPGLIDDLVASAKALGIEPKQMAAIDAERAKFERLARSLASS